MLSWLAKLIISRVMARTRAGDIGPTLQMDADDVVLRVPGDNSWSGEFRGKQEVERWLGPNLNYDPIAPVTASGAACACGVPHLVA